MKRFFGVSPLVAVLMLSSFVHHAAGALMSGDIAIIGMHNDTADEFSWVPLVNIPAGEVIYFSDAGFNSTTGTFQGDTPTPSTDEALLRFTAPAGGVAPGAVQTVRSGTSPANYDGPGTNTDFGALVLGGTINFSLTSIGDELIAFQSTDDPTMATFGQTNFTPLFQIDSGSNTRPLFTFDSGARTHTTDLHTDLTLGTNAVGLRDTVGDDEFDNIRYIGTSDGDQATLLAAIADSGNWVGTNDSQSANWTNSLGAGNNFNVIPEPGSLTLLSVCGLALFGVRRRNRTS